jgi:hypothetical protein
MWKDLMVLSAMALVAFPVSLQQAQKPAEKESVAEFKIPPEAVNVPISSGSFAVIRENIYQPPENGPAIHPALRPKSDVRHRPIVPAVPVP